MFCRWRSGLKRQRNVLTMSFAMVYILVWFYAATEIDVKRVIFQNQYAARSYRNFSSNAISLANRTEVTTHLVHTKSKDMFDYHSISTNVTMNLVVGYFRSGSSLTGDILQQSPNNFYLYEPVHDLTDVILIKKPVTYLDGSKRFFNASNMSEIHTEFLYNWFTCNLTLIDLGSLIHSDMSYHSKSTRLYYKCHKGHAGSRSKVKKCLSDLLKSCNSANVRTMKVIRVSMESVEYLLEKLQKLKVIHLLRDPRAILYSQISARAIRPQDLENQTSDHCTKMAKDMEITERLLMKFPGRIKPLYYERLAEDPLVKSRKIYQFLELKYSSSIERYIKSLTVSGRQSGCPWCVKRGNSARMAEKWRKKVNFKHLSVIDKYCKHVYDKAGYVLVSHEKDLRNLSFPLQNITSFMSESL